jgi:protochlorophyllide reductase
VDLTDPNFERRTYLPNTAYSQAKLANLLFALELDRHAGRAGLDLVSVAAHPGYTATSLVPNMARSRGRSPMAAAISFFGGLGDRLIGQHVRIGVLPQVYAATSAEVRGGEYYGPDGLLEMRGYPHRVSIPKAGQDAELAARLWDRTAELTKVDPDPA